MASSDQGLFFVREKEHIKVLQFDHSQSEPSVDQQEPLLALPTPKAALWSPNGKLLALADPANGVQVVEFAKGAEEGLHTLPGSSITTQTLQWSPDSKILVSFSPAVKGSTEPNVVGYSVDFEGGTNISQSFAFQYPKLEKDKKILQWTPDSSLCARLCQDGNVHILDGADVGGEMLAELALAHAVQNFEFAPVKTEAGRYRLAIFVPDVRDDMQRVTGPAEVTIWELAKNGEGEEATVNQYRKAVASVAAGQISELQWNSHGLALLAHCQTEVDETGASYYGGSKLLALSADGAYQHDLTEDEAPNGTSVQAVAWNPRRDEFVLIRGFQPAQATLWCWDEQAGTASMAKVLLEKAHRNTIRFNHFGSLVCLAGFGNLAGDVDFFGRRAGEKCDYARISSCQANCTVSAEWSLDGRHFLTAVLAPRMRVDNGIGVWRALSGSKVSQAMYEELFDVQWMPETSGNAGFSDVSADEVEAAIKELAAKGTSEGGAPKKQAYRPPKARGGEMGGSVAAMMRGEMAPDPADDRRSRKPREPARPPVRRDEEAPAASEEQDNRRGRTDSNKEADAAPSAAAPEGGSAGGAGKAAARRPPPPEQPVPQQPVPAQPKPKPAYEHQAAAGGYPPAKAAAVAPQAKPTPAPQQQPQPQAQQQQQAAAAAPRKANPAPAPARGAGAAVGPWTPQSAAFREQADPGQPGGGHGQKLPCPAQGWQYVDPKQNIQGPFTLLEMQQWHAMGYFRPNLPMRCDPADRFASFGELFPHPMIPFQSYPKRPSNAAANMGLR